MPRLSLYRPERGNDYKFIDKTIYEMFQVGGTDVHVHKYLGPRNPSSTESSATQPTYNAISETNIQDLLFLENRDRKYDPDIYVLRGVYNVQDIDFNLSQFGLFLQNDTIFMTLHINNSVDTIGRKIMPGDVFELPHLKDYHALNNFDVALKRFYVVEEIDRASEGFSATWYPHLYRIKLKPISDSQEFKDILDLPADEGSSDSLRDVLSSYNKDMMINDAIVTQAELDNPQSGYNTKHFYTLAVDEKGRPALEQGGVISEDSTRPEYRTPVKDGYSGYLLGDGVPPNGSPYGFGIQFPASPEVGDFFLRVDYQPNRLFRYDGRRWVKYEDKVRHQITNTDLRNRQKYNFINNDTVSNISGEQVVERQSLSQALKPKADN